MDLPHNVIRFETDAALTTGAAAALERGGTHAVAIGSQDERENLDVAALLQASAGQPAALVVGTRGGSQSRHRVQLLLLRLETGLRFTDVHGPRIYPLRLLTVINPTGRRRFGEIEILVRAVWAGCPIVQVSLPDTSGDVPGSVTPQLPASHQTWRTFATHFRLIARALSGWPHPKYDAGIAPPPRQSFWRRVWRWLNPFAASRELRQGGVSRNDMAVGLAAGAFIGNMPAWGFHTALSLYVAKRLHLNPLAVMTGSHASAPPMGPVLVASAMWIGHVILHGRRPNWDNMSLFHGHFLARALPLLLDWTLGALLIGTALAIVVYLVANFLFGFVERPVIEARADGVRLPDGRPEPRSPEILLPRA